MATKLAANEITAILERELQGYQPDVDLAEVGTVVSVGDGTTLPGRHDGMGAFVGPDGLRDRSYRFSILGHEA